MKSISLFSGGKDSFLSALIAMEQGHDIVATVTVHPHEDSMMFHFPNHIHAGAVSQLLNLRNIAIHEDTFREDIVRIVSETKAEALISGAIASNYQKTRIEKMCTELGIVSLTPLWLMDQEKELNSVISAGIRAMLVSVSADGLGRKYLGRTIDHELISELLSIKIKHGINISGEGGEYESFVLSYLGKDISVKSYRDIWNGSAGFRELTL